MPDETNTKSVKDTENETGVLNLFHGRPGGNWVPRLSRKRIL
jgi:hypothetical protein